MPANSAEYQKKYRETYRKRRKEITVGLDIKDYKEIRAFAQGEGKPLSAVMREASLLQIRGAKLKSKQVSDELKALKFLLSNIGNNINQMAHHSNRVKAVVDENEVFKNLQQLEQCISDFVSTRLSETKQQ